MAVWRWTIALLAAGAIMVGCGDDDGRVRPTPDAGGDRGDAGPVDAGPNDGGGSPDGGTTCVDEDGDGYGAGCALGPDCDDGDNAVSPAASETCNGVDDDCDGSIDDGITAPACALTAGVCAGATQRCGSSGFLACDATDYGDTYEMVESLCDGLDNDCDGTTDEGCTCDEGETQACGSDVGACTMGTQSCGATGWGACEGEVAPAAEVCNGVDDDCDGQEDEAGDLAASAPACPLQLGVCSGSRRTCGGVSGWIACSGTASYGGDFQATETLCDGLDNDCDGVTDEGCECVDGATQPCGSDVGACMAGTQTCTSGAWGSCAGEVVPTIETCNGVDDDCDGTPDDDLLGPPCELTEGVCAGARQACGGAVGFQACTAAQYGPRYQETESMCDGFDNDCDGVTDEGCECIDGTTQPCGSAVGTCTRGTQTCAGGAWGACTGGTPPSPELCNGLDDDCNGFADDALTAPSCALTEGVCAGTVQTCGGTAGWIACTAADYGARYLATESGGTDEAACDGLDNDCDGTPDEECTSGPVSALAEDEVSPDLFHRHLVYLANYDGNWDVVFANFETGERRRLTTTPANEESPRVYGNHVIFVRGEGAAAQVVLYDLRTDGETVLSSATSGGAAIYGGLALWHELVGGAQYDIFIHDIASGTTQTLFAGGQPGSNELSPAMRGNVIAFVSDASGTWLTQLIDLSAMTPTLIAQMPAATSINGQALPVVDYTMIGWTDGRATSTADAPATADWNIYGAPFQSIAPYAGFPGENAVSTQPAGQILRDIEGGYFLWSDYRNGNWDPAVGTLSGASVLLSEHPSAQFDPTMSGDTVIWADNRLGGFDLYGASMAVADPPAAGDLIINEILADPPAGADVNGDGAASTTHDEFVEIYNVTGNAIDLSGVTIADAGGTVRHTFPPRTVVPALGSVVVFGGGAIGSTSVFGGAGVHIASTGTLSLNNNGDTITLALGTTVIDTVTYNTTIADADQSIVRQRELDDAASFVRHSSVAGAIGAYSPGTSTDGFAF